MLVQPRVIGALSLLALSASSSSSRAEGAIALEYSAPQACPSRAEFEEAVQARGGRFEQPPSEVVGSALRVALRPDGSGFRGSLELQGVAAASGEREVRAEGCEEAMHGIAVITALLLREGSAEPPAPPSPAADAVSPAARAEASRLITAGHFQAERVTVGAGTLTFDNSTAYTLTGGAAVGWIPSVTLPRLDLTTSRANIVISPEGNKYLVAGVLPRARWTLLGGGSYQFGDLSTELLGMKAAFGTCVSLGYDLASFALLLCGEAAAGGMRIETKDAAGAKVQSKTVALGSVGLELELQYHLGSLLHLDLRAGGDAMLGGTVSAERADGSEIFRSSGGSLHLAGGVGLHF